MDNSSNFLLVILTIYASNYFIWISTPLCLTDAILTFKWMQIIHIILTKCRSTISKYCLLMVRYFKNL